VQERGSALGYDQAAGPSKKGRGVENGPPVTAAEKRKARFGFSFVCGVGRCLVTGKKPSWRGHVDEKKRGKAKERKKREEIRKSNEKETLWRQ